MDCQRYRQPAQSELVARSSDVAGVPFSEGRTHIPLMHKMGPEHSLGRELNSAFFARGTPKLTVSYGPLPQSGNHPAL